MKKLLTCLTAGLLVIGAQSLFAQSSTNSTPVTPTPGKHAGANPELRKERMEAMKLLGLSRADLKGLSAEDRKAKIKTATESYFASMNAKKTAGTLTPEDQANWDLVKKTFANAGHKKPAATTESN